MNLKGKKVVPGAEDSDPTDHGSSALPEFIQAPESTVHAEPSVDTLTNLRLATSTYSTAAVAVADFSRADSNQSSLGKEKIGVNDYLSLPGTLSELRDPLKCAILGQLSMFLSTTFLMLRPLDTEEKLGLTRILNVLSTLHELCVEANKADWVKVLEQDIDTINHIFTINYGVEASSGSDSPAEVTPSPVMAKTSELKAQPTNRAVFKWLRNLLKS